MGDQWDGGEESRGRFGIVVKSGTDRQLLEMGEGGQCNWNVSGCDVDKRRIIEVIEIYERYECAIFNCKRLERTYVILLTQGRCEGWSRSLNCW